MMFPELRAQFDFAKEQDWLDAFARFDAGSFIRAFQSNGELFWKRAGEKRALQIFRVATERVPAYRDFLKKNRVKPEQIKTIKDFEQVPLTDKPNYIKAYPIEARSLDGKIHSADLIAVSSGTSGEPTFWPRGGFQEFEAAVVHELLYRTYFQIEKRKTLLIIGFPMGIYVSGMATTIPSWLVSQKKENHLTVVTAGNDKASVLRVVSHLGKKYDQLVLVGHPFFVKDVIESGIAMGIRWRDMNVRMLFCSEGFSEAWREYVVKKARGRFDSNAAFSAYGSSELLLMAYETRMSIRLRRMIERSEKMQSRFFGDLPLPNLFQYNPFLRYIESAGNELVFTAASGTPLVRFNLHDSGKILPFSEAMRTAKLGMAKKKDGMWQLPFLALWGRSDQTIIFYAANIYPEHIKAVLEKKEFLGKLTGKFVMRKGMLRNMDEFLEVNIELRESIKPSQRFTRLLEEQILRKLCDTNMEYLDASTRLGKDMRPRVKLWPYRDTKYFKPGLKPRYILK